MYGPRSAYDPRDVARCREQAEQRVFRERIIAALRHPDVLAELRNAVEQAYRQIPEAK